MCSSDLVVAKRPVVDTTRTSLGTTISSELTDRTATSRDYQGVALLAPGVVNGTTASGNPSVHGFDRAAEWFSQPWSAGSSLGSGREQNALYWRPLAQATYALNHAGLDGVLHLFD